MIQYQKYEEKSNPVLGAIVGQQTKEVQARLDQLGNSLIQLKNVTDQLVDRLAPVLGPDTPQKETGQNQPPSLTSIGSQISEMTKHVRLIDEQLTYALDRLEL